MTRGRQAGFTLLEMLIAMTLLSLLLIALFSGLRFMGRTSEKVDSVIEESERLDLVRSLFDRQLANLFPMAAGAEGASKILFTGRADRLAFPILRLPGQGPAGLILAVFDITRERGGFQLIYREYPFRPGASVAISDTPTRSTLLAESAGAMRFRFFGQSWQEQWNDGNRLPLMVALDRADWPELVARPQAILAAAP